MTKIWNKYIKKSIIYTASIISIIYILLSDKLMLNLVLNLNVSDSINILLNKLLVTALVFGGTLITIYLYYKFRKKVRISASNYIIEVRYGDIFKIDNCKKVISFDECFTDAIGNGPADVNEGSICGQFLQRNPNINIKEVISEHKLEVKGKSKYEKKDKYESGRLITYDNYLLMPFAKLDKYGRGIITYKEFMDCLSILWEEIDKYYGQKDVCIPILGSGVTRFKDVIMTKQQLLDVIIASYKLNHSKIKKPNKLIIICDGDVALDKIGEVI